MNDTTPPAILHGFSVDVEDWFHIIDCDGAPATDSWAQQEDRVVHGTTRFLDLLDQYGHKATFFVLGWVAERHPDLIAEIAGRGHEVGSHSYGHAMVHSQDRDTFARDLDRSLRAIQSATGQDVRAYRAPGFSIGNEQQWAFEILASRGIDLDASLFLAPRAHGGFQLDRNRPFTLELPSGARLLEVPVIPWSPDRLTLPGGRSVALPWSGGGYMRLLPTVALEQLFADSERRGLPAITYLHPRELDPRQPRMKLPPWRAFKYYVGLDGVEQKLRRLFARYRFGTLRDVAAATDLDAPLSLSAAA